MSEIKQPLASKSITPTTSPIPSPTTSPIPSPTPSPTTSPIPSPTIIPSPTPSPTIITTPSPTPSPIPSPTPSPTIITTPSPTPSPIPSPTPSPLDEETDPLQPLSITIPPPPPPPLDTETDPLQQLDMVDIVFQSVKDSMIEHLVQLENKNELFKTLRIVIECIELQNLKGKRQQQQLAEQVLMKLILESKMDTIHKDLCISMIENGIIGDSIDIIISATNGEIKVNEAVKTITDSCLSSAVNSFKQMFYKK